MFRSIHASMKKFIFTLFLVIACSFADKPAMAHELKTDRAISVLLHINPDDDPAANQPSELLFLITDASEKFNPDDCNCKASVLDNDQTVFSSSLFTSKSSYGSIFAPAIPYTFPHKGVYTVQLTGTPKTPNGFQSFSFSYIIRIERDEPLNTKSPVLNIVYILIVGSVLAGIVYIIKLFVTNKNQIDIDPTKKI